MSDTEVQDKYTKKSTKGKVTLLNITIRTKFSRNNWALK